MIQTNLQLSKALCMNKKSCANMIFQLNIFRNNLKIQLNHKINVFFSCKLNSLFLFQLPHRTKLGNNGRYNIKPCEYQLYQKPSIYYETDGNLNTRK